MIIYHPKKWRGFSVLCGRQCLRGSVFPLVLPYAALGGLIAFLVKFDNEYSWGYFGGLGMKHREDSLFDHPYSLHMWAASLGFMLVFRGNLAYGRYWDGRRELARMCSYWQEVATACVCFDEVNKDINQYREWKQLILHQMSLLHALSIQCLRLDDELDNLVPFNRLEGYDGSIGAAGVDPTTTAPEVSSAAASAEAATLGANATGPVEAKPNLARRHSRRGAITPDHAEEVRSGSKRRNQRVSGKARRYSVTSDMLIVSLKDGLDNPKPLIATMNDNATATRAAEMADRGKLATMVSGAISESHNAATVASKWQTESDTRHKQLVKEQEESDESDDDTGRRYPPMGEEKVDEEEDEMPGGGGTLPEGAPPPAADSSRGGGDPAPDALQQQIMLCKERQRAADAALVEATEKQALDVESGLHLDGEDKAKAKAKSTGVRPRSVASLDFELEEDEELRKEFKKKGVGSTLSPSILGMLPCVLTSTASNNGSSSRHGHKFLD